MKMFSSLVGRPFRFEHLLGCVDSFAGVGVVERQDLLGRRLELELLLGKLDHFAVRWHGSLAEVAEHHSSVRLGNLLPGTKHHIVERLLEIELRHRRDRRPEASFADDIAHRHDDLGILFHDPVVAQHLGVGGQRSARHGTPRNQRFHGGRFGRQEIVLMQSLKTSSASRTFSTSISSS